MNSEFANLEPAFKNIMGRNFLIYTFHDRTKIIEYQLEMLANNRIPGLMKSGAVRIDGEIQLSYDITSLISLKKLFERREIGKEDFINILKQIIVLFDGLEEYLLDYGGVVFDSRFIFINPQNLQMEFAYVPAADMPQSLEPLKEFLPDVIIHDIRFKNEASDNYIQKLIEMLKSQELDINVLKNYVGDVGIKTAGTASGDGGDPASDRAHAGTEDGEYGAKRDMNNRMSDIHANGNIKNMRSDHVTPNEKPDAEYGMSSGSMPDIKRPDLTRHGLFRPSLTKPGLPGRGIFIFGYPARSFVILSSVIGAFLLFGIVLGLTGTLSADNPDFFLTLFGYLLIGGALAYLVYAKLFTADKKASERKTLGKESTGGRAAKGESAERNAAERKTVDIPQIPPYVTAGNTRYGSRYENMQYVNKSINIPKQRIDKANKEAAPTSDNFDAGATGFMFQMGSRENSAKNDYDDRTVILDAGSLKYPSLKGINGYQEPIILTRFPFMVGRLEKQVDYCIRNPAVGKLHAEIKKTADGYYITDINSRNGTLMNGERLEPSKEYKLENGVHITFANEEFIFSEGCEHE